MDDLDFRAVALDALHRIASGEPVLPDEARKICEAAGLDMKEPFRSVAVRKLLMASPGAQALDRIGGKSGSIERRFRDYVKRNGSVTRNKILRHLGVEGRIVSRLIELGTVDGVIRIEYRKPRVGRPSENIIWIAD